MEMDYESKFQAKNAKAAVRTGIITLLVCIFVIIPGIEYWEAMSDMRSALRSAKNVLKNMELISMEQFGLNKAIYSPGRASGLTEEAEEMVKNFAGVEGIIRLEDWDKKQMVVRRMTYIQDGFIIEFTRFSDEEIKKRSLNGDNTYGTWKIYRAIREYEASAGTL